MYSSNEHIQRSFTLHLVEITQKRKFFSAKIATDEYFLTQNTR